MAHKSKALDRIDRRILSELQENARIANQQLADTVGLSSSPCWRRIRRMEEEGVIDKYVTLLDPKALGISVVAFLHVSLENHHPETVQRFDRFVDRHAEIMECYSTSGRYDYLLRVVATSMQAYEEFLTTHLLQNTAVRVANTGFVLKQKKYTTALPLELAAPGGAR